MATPLELVEASASSYEIGHDWRSRCRLPSFASIHSYRMLAASFIRRGWCVIVAVEYGNKRVCNICLNTSTTCGRVGTRPICEGCHMAIGKCLQPRSTFIEEFEPYDQIFDVPQQWHDPQLPAMISNARRIWITAQICFGANTLVRRRPQCDICCKYIYIYDSVFDVDACGNCIAQSEPHADAFHRKILLLHNIGMLPEVIRTILDMFVQLHALWDNLNVVPYA